MPAIALVRRWMHRPRRSSPRRALGGLCCKLRTRFIFELSSRPRMLLAHQYQHPRVNGLLLLTLTIPQEPELLRCRCFDGCNLIFNRHSVFPFVGFPAKGGEVDLTRYAAFTVQSLPITMLLARSMRS